MLKLTGNSLGKRQRELNEEVHRAASRNVDFSAIKALEEQSDVDRLYKISIASVKKNIDYIIETLKCGDPLYISKALKCTWLYDNYYSYIVNSDYLHNSIFPFMSRKMKAKFLKTISKHVRDETRIIEFYEYCSKANMEDIAFKFLIWTPEEYKKEYLRNTKRPIASEKIFFGCSFDLIDVYLNNIKTQTGTNAEAEIYKFRYLYSVSNEKYLDLMEKYTDDVYVQWDSVPKFGLRLSKHIVTKHKDRILNNTRCYFRRLNINSIAKHTTVQNAMRYAVSLLPQTVDEFWYRDFYNEYKVILHILPLNTVYSFLKEIFSSKYPGETFEMSRRFYDLQYYKLLTDEEREAWALDHLKQRTDVMDQEDYRWYEFVNFNLAFEEIKKYIYVATDQSKRSTLVKILIGTAKTEEQREKLLNYYYERFVNEKNDVKISFIDDIIEKWEVLKFGDSCWDAFDKLLHAIKVYTKINSRIKFKTLSLIYHIIHQKEIPSVLNLHSSMVYESMYYIEIYCKQLPSEKKQLVYQYLMNICINKVKDLDGKAYNDVKEEISRIIYDTLRVLTYFEKTKLDCPDIILKYIKLDWDHYKFETLLRDTVPEENISDTSLLRLLKKDTNLLVEKLPALSDILKSAKIRGLLKKLRIYFANDVAQDFLRSCEALLLNLDAHEHYTIQAVVFCIFHIAKEDYKITFMSTYEPIDAKIPHNTVDKKLLSIQEGICRFAQYSRPPVPPTSVLNYIKGDYTVFCLPLFDSYAANLPSVQCHEFISAILSTPLSIQKHGLRLAFQTFNVQDLEKNITGAWKKTKNVSLRSRIYRALGNKIPLVGGDSQKKLYEIFKMFTLDLHEDDTDEVFSLMKQFNASNFKTDFLQAAWITVNKLSNQNYSNILRKHMILEEIVTHIDEMDKKFCLDHILDDFIKFMLIEKNLRPVYGDRYLETLISEKWKLAAKFIIYADSVDNHMCLELANLIFSKCIEMWDVKHDNNLTVRVFIMEFLNNILNYACDGNKKGEFIPILEHILGMLHKHLPLRHIYLLSIKMNLIINLKSVIGHRDDYKQLKSEEIEQGFGSKCLLVLNELKEKSLLYPIFYDKMVDLIVHVITQMLDYTNVEFDRVIIAVIDQFSASQLREARILALLIFKQNYGSYVKPYMHIIEKIESYNDDELSTYIYECFNKEDNWV